MQQLPKEPKFVTNVTGIQKLLAGISGSMFCMAIITLIPFVENLFRPKYIELLSTLRMAMAATALFLGGWVGIPQIKGMISWLFEFYEFYKKFKKDNSEG